MEVGTLAQCRAQEPLEAERSGGEEGPSGEEEWVDTQEEWLDNYWAKESCGNKEPLSKRDKVYN